MITVMKPQVKNRLVSRYIADFAVFACDALIAVLLEGVGAATLYPFYRLAWIAILGAKRV